MATFSFYADSNNLNGSGLGFFGSSFGNSVEVAAYQDTTYITDGNGAIQGSATYNNKWANVSGVYNSSLGAAALKHLLEVPNYLTTLNIRFTHASAVKLQNTKLRIFDRSNVNNNPSGVTCKVAQIIHVATTADYANGSGDATWVTPVGSAVIMDLDNSPGVSGLHGTSTTWTDTQHDYYVLLSASPDSIGAKSLFGLYVSCEYL